MTTSYIHNPHAYANNDPRLLYLDLATQPTKPGTQPAADNTGTGKDTEADDQDKTELHEPPRSLPMFLGGGPFL